MVVSASSGMPRKEMMRIQSFRACFPLRTFRFAVSDTKKTCHEPKFPIFFMARGASKETKDCSISTIFAKIGRPGRTSSGGTFEERKKQVMLFST
jgi:hypothetical protein